MSKYQHSRLESAGTKPKADEVEVAEIVVNLEDKLLYTKNHNGLVVAVGGSGSGGGIPEAPINGRTYGRKDAGWTTVQTIDITDTPLLSGPSVVNEKKSIDLTITNYSSTATYVISSEFGSTTRTDGVITYTANDITDDVNHNGKVEVSAQETNELVSDKATQLITVQYVPYVNDQQLVYDASSMTEFTTLTNMKLADSDTKLLSTAYNGEAISNVIDQDAGDTDFVGCKDITSKFEFPTLDKGSSTADTLITSTEIKDGDNMVILLDDETTYTEFVANGVTGGIRYNSTYDENTLGNKLELDDTKLIVTSTATKYADSNAYSIDKITGGSVYFDTEITAAIDTQRTRIGISLVNSYQDDQFAKTSNGYCYASSGLFENNDGNTGVQVEAWDNGDTIRTKYTYETGELEFYKNGVSQGIAYTLSPNTEVYFVVSINNDGGRMQSVFLNSAFQLDTSAQTNGEIPTRAFAVGTDVSFEIEDGTYIEANSNGNSYTNGTTANPILNATRTHDDVISATLSRTIKTKVVHKNAGTKMTELSATILKDN